jgi:DNA-binding transcriptional MerR regulator
MDQSNNYLTISDLAKELDVKKSHIRFCEENGLISPRASKLKRRVYNRYDRERLKLVFHFVLLGYSKEQIIDLIGIPDGHIDENEQLMQGIEYALNELKNLEKRKEELSFTKQTRTINEIEMLREYIKNIKIIKSGVFEEPSARPGIRFEDKAKIPTIPVTAITAEAEKRTTQHPAKVISVFVAGLALVVFIGSYFYHQAGQNETKTIKLDQKKPIHSEKILVPQMPEPVNQTAKAPVVTPEPQKIPESNSQAQPENLSAQSTDASLDATKRNGEIRSESDTNLLKNEKPIEKQALISPEIEETPKDVVNQEVNSERLKEKAVPAAAGKKRLTPAISESGVEKVTETEVKPSLTEPEKEMEKIASEEDINQQQNELSRLKAFLIDYCQAYSNKDLDKFITFFTSDATENNKPFHELLPDYRENMNSKESLKYRIELMSYSKQTTTGSLMIRGKFFTRYQSQKGVLKEDNGNIFMELLENGNSFLVKQLNY